MTKKRSFEKKLTYVIGKDLTQEEYDVWELEVALWISENQVNETDPKAKAKKVMQAALAGTKLDGGVWTGAPSFTFDARIRQLCGYNILTGEGARSGRPPQKSRTEEKRVNKETSKARAVNESIADRISLEKLITLREQFKATLYKEFPFLDNPVYENQVNAYSDTVVKLDQLSDMFLGASGKDLETYLKIREQLRKDLDEFMKILRIHPSQIKEKVDEGDRGDVGALIDRWEEYGELADMYEVVDAIQEALQIFNQLNNKRLDGSPQLAEWLLWHKTGCRGHTFTCECGREYDLHGGFTKDEMVDIVEQAYKVFGYGISYAEDEERKEISGQAQQA